MTETRGFLVTGGAGFIGSHIAERLLSLGHSVRVVDNLSTGHQANIANLPGDLEFVRGDLRSAEICQHAVTDIDVVFHVAALPSVPRSLADPGATHDNNVNATMRLLEACTQVGVRRVVFSSSSSVYGDTPDLPKVESVEPLPMSPYAASKLAAEQYVLAFARAGLIEGVALRYFNVFGPRQDPNSAYAAVIPAFIQATLEGKPVTVYGDGNQTRDFTYVDNVVDANLAAAFADPETANGIVTNVGAGRRTSLLDLLTEIGHLIGHNPEVEEAAPRPGDVRDSLASLERSERVLGYRPSVDLRAGLERTLHWIRGRLAA